MTCFTQLKLNLHWRGPRWSAGPLRCRTKACHSTRALVSALAWFGSVLEAAVGGAPDDASRRMLARAEPAMPASLCRRVGLVVLEFKSCTPLSPVQLKRAGNKCVRCAQHTHKLFHLSGAGECHASFMEATGGSVKMFMGANELTQPHHRNTHREPKKHRSRHTDTQTETHIHTRTHTWEAGVRHVGHILVVFIMREAQLLHTHRCPHGVNKCDCMLAHH